MSTTAFITSTGPILCANPVGCRWHATARLAGDYVRENASTPLNVYPIEAPNGLPSAGDVLYIVSPGTATCIELTTYATAFPTSAGAAAESAATGHGAYVIEAG